MLVLSRKVGEWVHIGECRVMIVKIDRGRVRIGIQAGEEVLILRGELGDLAQRRKGAKRELAEVA